MKRYYVTTPIYYANGRPHLGNTYTTTLADSLTRYHRFLGCETFFLTGTDEHGDKVQAAAVAAGKSPQAFTDEVSEHFKRTWKELGLEYSRFIRTTEPAHKAVVTSILQKIYDKGDIYFGEYGGLYCLGCERFLTEKELVDEKCPDHQVKPTFLKEQNYFFRMSKYQDQLVKHITEVAPDFIRPERYKNEVLAMLREPLEDLCISRPKSRLTWGIELPFDANYVTYVWFDALINYLSALEYSEGENFKKFWPVCEHLIAKDIVKPHGVFWPTMLMAAEIPLFQHLSVHGYWITPTGKMSKSLGNVVDPVRIKNEYGMDVFRYFVLRDMAFGLDGTFSDEGLDARYHADLANNLGNLVSRSLAMVHKYRGGIVPEQGTIISETDKALSIQALETLPKVDALLKKMEVHRAVEQLWALIHAGNVYIDRTKPWALAKDEFTDAGKKAELDSVLYSQLELLRIVAALLTAFLPNTSRKIFEFLGYQPHEIADEQKCERVTTWGLLPAGRVVQKGEPLFPRKDLVKKVETQPQKTKANMETPSSPSAPNADCISYDEFSKVDLRVGQILEAQKVEKSDKLIRLQVDLGKDLGTRQIVAGIAKFYSPETLIGRKVAVVANLKPAKLMGIESQGMLLAGSDDIGNLELVSVSNILVPGSKIK